jgi:hypothetical protein
MAKYKYPAQQRYDEKQPPIAFRLDRETYSRVKSYSRLTGRSMKDIMKESLVQWLDEKDGVKPKKKGLVSLFLKNSNK